MGRATKAAARRFLEQQSAELPFCLPQQQHARQPQQQYRFSGVLCAPCGSCGCPGEHSSASELAGGNQSGVQEESRPVPVMHLHPKIPSGWIAW